MREQGRFIICISADGRAWRRMWCNKSRPPDMIQDAWWPVSYRRIGTCWGIPVYREAV